MELKKVEEGVVPRRVNPLMVPVPELAEELFRAPGQWHLVGLGKSEDRSRLNNAAAALRSGRHRSLDRYYQLGRFEATLSSGRGTQLPNNAEVAVYARFVPHGKVSER